jgi:hypothetical protein
MMKPSTPRTGTRRARSFPPAEQLERRVLLSVDVHVRLFHDADGNAAEGPGEGPFSGGGQPGLYVYADLDGDGTWDAEVATLEPRAVFAEDGTAILPSLPDGAHTVRVVQPGTRFTTGDSAAVTVSAGGQDPSPVVLGANRSTRVVGAVYHDQDASGDRDPGEPGLPRRRVWLDLNLNRLYDAGEPFTLTDADGTYRFNQEIPTGRVRAEVPAGWRTSENPYGADHSADAGYAYDEILPDFGQTTLPPPGSITGSSRDLFLDADGDGVRDTLEESFPLSVRAYLDANANGLPDGDERVFTPSGSYEIRFIQPGQYPFRVLAPPNWVQTTPVPMIEVRSGELVRVPPIGFQEAGGPAAVQGVVYVDDDFDGVRDPGERGASRVRVTLDVDNSDGQADPQVLADADGHYTFRNLPAGTYRVVTDTNSAGLLPVVPRNPAQTVTFDGTTPAVADFGGAQRFRTARLTGRVYHDANGDGVFGAGDVPLPNVKVFEVGGVGGFALTDADGIYILAVAYSSASVNVEDPAGWEGAPRFPVRATAPPLQTSAGPDFGLAPAGGAATGPLPAAIAGAVFFDVDADGVRDPGDGPPFSLNVPPGAAYLDLNRNALRDATEPTATPDDRGNFAFGGLTAGTYDVRLSTAFPGVPGYLQTKPLLAPYTVTLAPDQRSDPLELGFGYLPAGASGSVYLDSNQNGVRDDGEVPAPYVRVILDWNHDGVFTDGSPDRTTTTDADGRFVFALLPPGQYAAVVFTDADQRQTDPANGAAVTFTVAPGQSATGLSLGAYRPTGWLSGMVYYDASGDGAYTVYEDHGVEARIVRIVSAEDANRVYQTSTDYAGRWRIGGIPAGAYRIVAPEGPPDSFYTEPTAPPFEYTVNLPAGREIGGFEFGMLTGPRYGAQVNDRKPFYYEGADAEPVLTVNGDPVAAAAPHRIAADKTALLPGRAPTFANVTSYARGINGLVIDMSGLRPDMFLRQGDFEFAVSAGGPGATWTSAPAPATIYTTPPGFPNGTARVTLTWPDGAIRNTWLRVTIKAGLRTRLEQPDVFYIGNLVGETGDTDAAPFRVNALDLAGVKRALNTPSAITGRYDFNRDMRVNALDVALVKRNLGVTLGAPTAAAAAVSVPAPAALPPTTLDLSTAASRRVWDEPPPDVL